MDEFTQNQILGVLFAGLVTFVFFYLLEPRRPRTFALHAWAIWVSSSLAGVILNFVMGWGILASFVSLGGLILAISVWWNGRKASSRPPIE